MKKNFLLLTLGFGLLNSAPALALEPPSELVGDVQAITTANRWGENTNKLYEIYDAHRADIELAFEWANNEMFELKLDDALEPSHIASDDWIDRKLHRLQDSREALRANEQALAIKFTSLRHDIAKSIEPNEVPVSFGLFFEDMQRLSEEAYAANIDIDRLLISQIEAQLNLAYKAKRVVASNGKSLLFADAGLQQKWDNASQRTRALIQHLPDSQAVLFPNIN